MKKILLSSLLIMISQPSFADGLKENQYAFPEKGTPNFPRQWFPYTHYSILNKVYDDTKTKIEPAPCNYSGVPPNASCYLEEVATIRLYFKSVPKRMQKKGFNHQQIARFKREHRVFEKRAAARCEKEGLDSLGSGGGLLYFGCYYRMYHPRFLKLKRMLGEPHPVRRHSSN